MLSPIFLAAALAESRRPAADARAASATPPNVNIPLWEPGKVPIAKGDGRSTRRSEGRSSPEGKRNGASVIIAPAAPTSC